MRVALLVAMTLAVGCALAQEAPAKPEAPPVSAATPATSTTSEKRAADASEKAKAEQPPTNDPKEILRRSVQKDQDNARILARSYTYRSRDVERDIDKDGNVKKTTISTFDHFFLYGRNVQRLVEKDDKPLSDKDAQKEEERIQKIKEKSEKESAADREKRRAEREKEREESRKFLLQIPDAYDLEMKPPEMVNGRECWVIGLTPKPGFKPTIRFGEILSKIRGKLWIDKAEYQWTKAEADLIDDFSFGWFLVRLHKGAHLEFEATKVNDEVWLPRFTRVSGSVRIALLKNERGDEEETFSNYQKFRTEAKITGVAEAPPEQ